MKFTFTIHISSKKNHETIRDFDKRIKNHNTLLEKHYQKQCLTQKIFFTTFTWFSQTTTHIKKNGVLLLTTNIIKSFFFVVLHYDVLHDDFKLFL